jgi:two-component system cell cycle response regulator
MPALEPVLGQALELALTDPLTGLYNQRYLMRHLRGLMASGKANSVGVLMIDVDHFKQVNDRFGHAAGDKALKAIADVLRGRTRVFDSIARYGGEEFTVIMPDTKIEDAQRIAERIRLHVAGSPFRVAHGEELLTVTMSIGVATTLGERDSPEALLKRADEAVYEAKSAGRNKVVARAA